MRRVDHPRFTTALRQVEDSIDAAWDSFCVESGGTAEAQELAEVVLQDTSEFDWRIVDGALIRVSSAVARTRHRYSPRARAGYELLLPDLLDGALPTTAQAQRAKHLINQLTDDELEHLITPADLQQPST